MEALSVPPAPASGLTIPEAARIAFAALVAWYFRKCLRHRKWRARRRRG